jgi:hypothetical protein
MEESGCESIKPIGLEPAIQDSRIGRFLHHLHELGSEAKLDYSQDPNKISFIGRTALSVTTQLCERAQATVLIVPPVTLDVLHSTHSPIAAGLTAGGLTLIWNNLVGESLTQGMAKFPNTVSGYRKHFLRSTEVVYDTLPANHAFDTKDGSLPSIDRRIGQSLIYHVLNGSTATLRGMTSYVATTSVKKDRAKSEIKKFYRKAALDGAAFTAALTTGITEVVAYVGISNPELANKIQDYEGNKLVGYGVLATLALGEFVMNRRRKRLQPRLAE